MLVIITASLPLVTNQQEPMDPKRPASEPLLDHALLIAGIAVSQASTSTATLAERMDRQQDSTAGDSLGALAEIFARHGVAAVDGLHGSFHPRLAHASAGKARSRLMKAGFTLAF